MRSSICNKVGIGMIFLFTKKQKDAYRSKVIEEYKQANDFNIAEVLSDLDKIDELLTRDTNAIQTLLSTFEWAVDHAEFYNQTSFEAGAITKESRDRFFKMSLEQRKRIFTEKGQFNYEENK